MSAEHITMDRLVALVIIGTRPEAIKLAPIILELQKSVIVPYVVCSGQHVELVEEVLKVFNIIPNKWLDKRTYPLEYTSSGSIPDPIKPPLDLATNYFLIGQQLSVLINEIKPHMIIVQGDTLSAMAGGVASFLHKIKLIHVEAGLRSNDMYHPFPEEYARKVIGMTADYHFPPTEKAKYNLLKECVPKDKIYMVGNTVVDALKYVSRLPRIVDHIDNLVLVTAHRRESWGLGIQNICHAIGKLAINYRELNFIFFCHPNPIVLNDVNEILKDKYDNIKVMPPASYHEFSNYLLDAKFVISDSGGVVEEASSLGKYTFITRYVTERIETIDAGLGELVGTEIDTIYNTVEKYIEKKDKVDITHSNIYGDGTSSKSIVDLLIVNEIVDKREGHNMV
jgi:UDP-N-acetylglucosamine 2-epimerase (non-hydrolysing)